MRMKRTTISSQAFRLAACAVAVSLGLAACAKSTSGGSCPTPPARSAPCRGQRHPQAGTVTWPAPGQRADLDLPDSARRR